ncbi:hypothetical protein COOONC_23763, partial [Cooperia oncophora]
MEIQSCPQWCDGCGGRLLTALLIHAVIVQPISAYSRFGRQSDEIRALYSKGAPLSINEQMLGGSNIHYYGRFRLVIIRKY